MILMFPPSSCPDCGGEKLVIENGDSFFCEECGYVGYIPEVDLDINDPDFHDHYEDGTPVIEPTDKTPNINSEH
ncbi:hypothetical protein Cal6303_2650 [Calothrix sp. PCC 6303]|nr:hypothetical protein Cal6303_2650 [Calothrix sp. PCC 6303]